MPILELGRAFPVQSHVRQFGSDWLSLSKAIVVTDKEKKQVKPLGFDLPGGVLQ